MEEHILEGTPASFGKVVGKAKVIDIFNIDSIQLEELEGKIIVAKYTLPELTPIFLKIRGIITENGAILSHAAIISREFGVPCVIGIQDATKKIKDNDEIEIDADKGIVKLLKKV